MNSKLLLGCLLFLSLSFFSCAPRYTVSKEFLKEQMYTEAKHLMGDEINPDVYKFSGFERIKCFDKDGNVVVFPIDSKTRVVFSTKSGEKVPMHFSSIVFKKDTLTGQYSSTLDIERKVPFEKIDDIRVFSELKVRRLERE